MSDLRETLLTAVAPVLPADVDLEDIEVAKAGRRQVVRVVIDRDGGIDLDLIASVSHAVSELLDDDALSAPLGEAFTLEVTSPGIDRPLTLPRHWQRNVTRLVIADLADGTALTGRITAVTPEGVVLEPQKGEPRELSYADLVRGTVQIEFNRGEAQ